MTEGIWSIGFEDSSVLFVAGSAVSSEDGKSDFVFPEEMSLGPSDFIILVEHGGLDDGDTVLLGSMVSCHFSMQLTDSSVERDISVFFVHIVVSGS